MDRRLPFRGDRVGHLHLLPTDARLWLLMREDTGLEKLPYATVQRTELALAGVHGEAPPWLRCGLFELLARVELAVRNLVLRTSTFPILHQAGSIRAPIEATAERGWSRYQEPRRWYTSILVTAFLFETAPRQLARALADPTFSLVETVDAAAFDAWVDQAVTDTETEPAVLIEGAFSGALEPAALGEDEMDAVMVRLALLHRRGAKAFGLTNRDRDPIAGAWEELRGDGPGEACLGLAGEQTAEGLYARGMCLWNDAPAAAEEAFRRAWRTDRAMVRAALHSAALALADEGREGDATPLVEAAIDATPADSDAVLLEALIAARQGDCRELQREELPEAWSPIRHLDGPLEAYRDRFVREVLECGSVGVQ